MMCAIRHVAYWQDRTNLFVISQDWAHDESCWVSFIQICHIMQWLAVVLERLLIGGFVIVSLLATDRASTVLDLDLSTF
jgi:hypothetical protein